MSSRGAQVVVLCEDQQSSVFVERLLETRGYDRRALRVIVAPAGMQSGEQYVREEYSRWVRFFRQRRATKAIVAQIDADARTTRDRHADFAAVLKQDGQPPRAPDEEIVELVPRRNIETWIHALDPSLEPALARPLDETTRYSKLDHPSDAGTAAQTLARLTPAAAAAAHTTLPSIADGVAELRRLP